MAQQYFIRNCDQDCEFMMTFWALNNAGYTSNIDNAKKFTYQQAKRILAESSDGKFAMIPVEAVELSSIRCVHTVNNIDAFYINVANATLRGF